MSAIVPVPQSSPGFGSGQWPHPHLVKSFQIPSTGGQLTSADYTDPWGPQSLGPKAISLASSPTFHLSPIPKVTDSAAPQSNRVQKARAELWCESEKTPKLQPEVLFKTAVIELVWWLSRSRNLLPSLLNWDSLRSPRGRKRGPTPESCPLTSTRELWHAPIYYQVNKCNKQFRL